MSGEPSNDPIPEIDIPMQHEGPIKGLDRLRTSLLFAQISRISYLAPGPAEHYISGMGLHLEHFADRNGAQA